MEKTTQPEKSSKTKIAVISADSACADTIALKLSQTFSASFVPHLSVEMLLSQRDNEYSGSETFFENSQSHIENENQLTEASENLMFSATNIFSNLVLSQMLYGDVDERIELLADEQSYDLILFAKNPQVPSDFEKLQSELSVYLTEKKLLFIEIIGNENELSEKALRKIECFLKVISLGMTAKDFLQIEDSGVSVADIARHLMIFKKGMSSIILDRPALRDDGILSFSDAQFVEFATSFAENSKNLKLKKFVPASGAASRMFKFLTEFIHNFEPENDSINGYINKNNASQLRIFLSGIEKFPFYRTTEKYLQAHFPDYKFWTSDHKYLQFIKTMLTAGAFNFAHKPKAVLPFHKYDHRIATPIEEQLNETALYACANHESNLHFTISDEHRGQFEAVVDKVKPRIEQISKCKITVTYSLQNPATDTIAVDENNVPFRKSDGTLYFRPGGHGALIGNLSNLAADVIFIKNIDNVMHDHNDLISLYKRGLGGLLLNLQEQMHAYLKLLESGNFTPENSTELMDFMQSTLQLNIEAGVEKFTLDNQIEYFIEKLNRPIRVCGMVRNEGEPGGGPFWVRDNSGQISLQVVETAQIDKSNREQLAILTAATHFNPVDIVCATKDHRGNRFDLHDFVDPKSGFIVEKHKDGQYCKAYELPGLWNGAMSRWISVFVEVPSSTFNPVKTVNDLLKSAHQP